MTEKTYFSKKRVLVTGASGFIGAKLCGSLRKLDANIFGVSTQKQNKSDVIDKWYIGDLADFDFTKAVVRKSNPDIIFHLAGFTSGHRGMKAIEPTFNNNLLATVNILTASTGKNIDRLVLAGSMEEPDSGNEKPVPVSPYAASKWASSAYARMYHKLYKNPVTIARIFMVYGPGPQDYMNIIPYVIHCLINHKQPKLTSGKRLVDWIYIDDVVRGLLRMAIVDGIEGKTIDLGSGKQESIRKIASRIKTIIGGDTDIIFGALPDRPYERICVADPGMARKYLNWMPKVGINEGLQRTIEWYRDRAGEKFQGIS